MVVASVSQLLVLYKIVIPLIPCTIASLYRKICNLNTNDATRKTPADVLLHVATVYCFLFVVKKFRGCKSFPSFPEKYSRLCRSAYYNWPSYNVSAQVSPKNFRGHEVIHENRETFSS